MGIWNSWEEFLEAYEKVDDWEDWEESDDGNEDGFFIEQEIPVHIQQMVYVNVPEHWRQWCAQQVYPPMSNAPAV